MPTLILMKLTPVLVGATADAVGERLQRLSQNVQIFVQPSTRPGMGSGVGAEMIIGLFAEIHNNRTVTGANRLDPDASRRNCKDALSGATITREAQSCSGSIAVHDASPRRRQSSCLYAA